MQITFGFLTELVAVKVREAGSIGRPLWRLQTDLAFLSQRYGLIVVPAGYVVDFASVPRLPFAFWLFGDTAHASAAVHDYCVAVLVPRGSMTWQQAAEIFGEAMEHEGVPLWRRWLMKNAVIGADPANQWESPI